MFETLKYVHHLTCFWIRTILSALRMSVVKSEEESDILVFVEIFLLINVQVYSILSSYIDSYVRFVFSEIKLERDI
jgi:hypothetical protein